MHQCCQHQFCNNVDVSKTLDAALLFTYDLPGHT